MKRLCKTLLCLFILSAIVTAGLFSALIYHNYMLSTTLFQKFPFLLDFEQDEDSYPYAEALEQGTLDLTSLSKTTFLDEVGLIGLPERKEYIASPITISYYADTNDRSPVYTIEKGDIIYFKIATQRSSVTYHGIQSLPTSKAGWRLAKPFIVDGEEPNDTLLYVKTDDLFAVSREWYEENSLFESSLFKNTFEKAWMMRNYPKLDALYIDRLFFYPKGIFLSPDWAAYVYPPAPFISLGVSAILLAAYLILRRRVKKLNKQQKRLSL